MLDKILATAAVAKKIHDTKEKKGEEDRKKLEDYQKEVEEVEARREEVEKERMEKQKSKEEWSVNDVKTKEEQILRKAKDQEKIDTINDSLKLESVEENLADYRDRPINFIGGAVNQFTLNQSAEYASGKEQEAYDIRDGIRYFSSDIRRKEREKQLLEHKLQEAQERTGIRGMVANIREGKIDVEQTKANIEKVDAEIEELSVRREHELETVKNIEESLQTLVDIAAKYTDKIVGKTVGELLGEVEKATT